MCANLVIYNVSLLRNMESFFLLQQYVPVRMILF